MLSSILLALRLEIRNTKAEQRPQREQTPDDRPSKSSEAELGADLKDAWVCGGIDDSQRVR